jgi:hypothetical protein
VFAFAFFAFLFLFLEPTTLLLERGAPRRAERLPQAAGAYGSRNWQPAQPVEHQAGIIHMCRDVL